MTKLLQLFGFCLVLLTGGAFAGSAEQLSLALTLWSGDSGPEIPSEFTISDEVLAIFVQAHACFATQDVVKVADLDLDRSAITTRDDPEGRIYHVVIPCKNGAVCVESSVGIVGRVEESCPSHVRTQLEKPDVEYGQADKLGLHGTRNEALANGILALLKAN